MVTGIRALRPLSPLFGNREDVGEERQTAVRICGVRLSASVEAQDVGAGNLADPHAAERRKHVEPKHPPILPHCPGLRVGNRVLVDVSLCKLGKRWRNSRGSTCLCRIATGSYLR